MSPILYAFLLTLVLIFLTWLWSIKINNYSIIDAVWSFAFALHAAVFLSFVPDIGSRHVVLFSMICAWSLRLGFFLTRRLYQHHPVEDTRYQKLRQDYGTNVKFRFFVFFIYQAISVSILTLPFGFVFADDRSDLNIYEMVGVLYWLVSLIGESIADGQMNRFKSNPANKGQVCNIGLWNYSRHPNYFFESQIWFGFFIFAIGSGIYWGVYAPIIILMLLLKVTGVPPSEEQSLKTRGDLYRQYQARTSVFIPWFPKK